MKIIIVLLVVIAYCNAIWGPGNMPALPQIPVGVAPWQPHSSSSSSEDASYGSHTGSGPRSTSRRSSFDAASSSTESSFASSRSGKHNGVGFFKTSGKGLDSFSSHSGYDADSSSTESSFGSSFSPKGKKSLRDSNDWGSTQYNSKHSAIGSDSGEGLPGSSPKWGKKPRTDLSSPRLQLSRKPQKTLQHDDHYVPYSQPNGILKRPGEKSPPQQGKKRLFGMYQDQPKEKSVSFSKKTQIQDGLGHISKGKTDFKNTYVQKFKDESMDKNSKDYKYGKKPLNEAEAEEFHFKNDCYRQCMATGRESADCVRECRGKQEKKFGKLTLKPSFDPEAKNFDKNYKPIQSIMPDIRPRRDPGYSSSSSE